jgi:hypothetical protein
MSEDWASLLPSQHCAMSIADWTNVDVSPIAIFADYYEQCQDMRAIRRDDADFLSITVFYFDLPFWTAIPTQSLDQIR